MKPVSFITITSKKQTKIAHYWLAGTFVICGLAIIMTIFSLLPFITQLYTQHTEIQKLEVFIKKNKQIVNQHTFLKKAQDEYTQLEDKFIRYENHPNMPIALFTTITSTVNKAGNIDSMRCDKKKISLQMHISDITKISDMVKELKSNELIKKVVIVSLSEKNNDNDQYFVSLAITSRYYATKSNVSKSKL